MGLGLSASRLIRPHTDPRNLFLLRSIVTKPELQSPEAAPAAASPEPTPDLPPQSPLAGARFLILMMPSRSLLTVTLSKSLRDLPFYKPVKSLALTFLAFVISLPGNCRMCLLRSRSRLSLLRLVSCLLFLGSRLRQTHLWQRKHERG